MNTWEAYKEAESSISSASASASETAAAISEHVTAMKPLTSEWLRPLVADLRLRASFLGIALIQLEQIEALEARRDLLTTTPDSPIRFP